VYGDDDIICDFFVYKEGLLSYDSSDEPHEVNIDVINTDGSTALTACSTQQMQVISDTSKKKIPFIKDPALDIKSIICIL